MKNSTDKLRRMIREILSEAKGRTKYYGGRKRLNMTDMRKHKVPMIGSSINAIGTRAENLVRVLCSLPLVVRHAPAGPEPDVTGIKWSMMLGLSDETGGAVEVKSTNIFNPEKMSCKLRLELTKRDAKKMQGGATVEDIQAFVVGYFNRHPLVAFPTGRGKGNDCCIVVKKVTETTIEDGRIVISTPLTDEIADDIWRRALSGKKPMISVRINAKARGDVKFVPSIRERMNDPRLTNWSTLNLFNAVYAGVDPQYIIDNKMYITHGHWTRAEMYPNEDLEELKRQRLINKGIKKFRR